MMLKSNCIGSKKAIELFIDDVIFNPEKLVSNTGVFEQLPIRRYSTIALKKVL